jgi:hypothetical protein
MHLVVSNTTKIALLTLLLKCLEGNEHDSQPHNNNNNSSRLLLQVRRPEIVEPINVCILSSEPLLVQSVAALLNVVLGGDEMGEGRDLLLSYWSNKLPDYIGEGLRHGSSQSTPPLLECLAKVMQCATQFASTSSLRGLVALVLSIVRKGLDEHQRETVHFSLMVLTRVLSKVSSECIMTKDECNNTFKSLDQALAVFGVTMSAAVANVLSPLYQQLLTAAPLGGRECLMVPSSTISVSTFMVQESLTESPMDLEYFLQSTKTMETTLATLCALNASLLHGHIEDMGLLTTICDLVYTVLVSVEDPSCPVWRLFFRDVVIASLLPSLFRIMVESFASHRHIAVQLLGILSLAVDKVLACSNVWLTRG